MIIRYSSLSSSQNGLGISKQVVFKASKLMFAKMFIPHSIKTGETLRVPVTVFNNYDSYLSVRPLLYSYMSLRATPLLLFPFTLLLFVGTCVTLLL